MLNIGLKNKIQVSTRNKNNIESILIKIFGTSSSVQKKTQLTLTEAKLFPKTLNNFQKVSLSNGRRIWTIEKSQSGIKLKLNKYKTNHFELDFVQEVCPEEYQSLISFIAGIQIPLTEKVLDLE